MSEQYQEPTPLRRLYDVAQAASGLGTSAGGGPLGIPEGGIDDIIVTGGQTVASSWDDVVDLGNKAKSKISSVWDSLPFKKKKPKRTLGVWQRCDGSTSIQESDSGPGWHKIQTIEVDS